MTKKTIATLFIIHAFTFTSTVYADTDVVTTVSVGAINMDTNIRDTLRISDTEIIDGTVTNNRKSKVDTSGAEIAITVISDNLYFGFNTLITGQSASDYSNHYVQVHPSLETDEFIANPETVSLTSYNAYAGYSIANNMRLYGGFTQGKSNAGEEMFIEEFGPFVGFQYINGLGPSSSITFDISYSSLNTELNLKENGDNYFSAGNQDGYTIDADTTGFSYSITWLKSLDRGRSFFIKLKFVDLDIENGSVAVTGPLDGVGTASVDGSKTIASLSLGMGF